MLGRIHNTDWILMEAFPVIHAQETPSPVLKIVMSLCKHADDSGLVENVMMRIETRETEDDGQQVCILTEKEKAALELCK